ncbi:MAG: EndoU domain-containing protein [Marinoscillum sp.]
MEGKVGKYYCVTGLGDDSKTHRLPKPFRIYFVEDSHPFVPSQLTGYSTIEELRKKDPIWRKYHEKDPQSATKICKPEFILSSKYFVLTPYDEEFSKVSYKLLKHTIMGELQKEITGVHMISKLNPHILSFSEKCRPDTNGVWVADIEYFSKERNQPYLKENSSMFPKSWDPTIFMFKMFFAYKVKKQCKSDPTIFHSITDCGVPVDFVIRNGKLKSAYPIYRGENPPNEHLPK